MTKKRRGSVPKRAMKLMQDINDEAVLHHTAPGINRCMVLVERAWVSAEVAYQVGTQTKLAQARARWKIAKNCLAKVGGGPP